MVTITFEDLDDGRFTVSMEGIDMDSQDELKTGEFYAMQTYLRLEKLKEEFDAGYEAGKANNQLPVQERLDENG
jgi:hypothetical protein